MWNILRYLDADSEIFHNLPELYGENVILRKARLSDARDMYEWCRDEEVARFVQWRAYDSVGDAKRFLKFIRRQYKFGEPSSWVIEDRDTGKMVGTIGYMWWNREYHSAEVGYSLARGYWNRGYMTEALKLALGFGFEKMRLNRIEAQHVSLNTASGRVMQKCGMRREGTLRGRIYSKGKYEDMVLYAILKDDKRL
ncbi:MAG: GNAT family N-acetyltransferase [Oscillospiraceae bacterium]|jgi:ribosomal-protein-alanine N-acetyltransferase|nr:GNAT family N-acetyltransferase [Oscillospiraceae bacterium]